MIRTISIAAASLLVGSGLTYLLLAAPEAGNRGPAPQSSATADAPVPLQEPAANAVSVVSLLDGRFGVGERAAVYGVVAKAGAEQLQAMAQELWAANKSASTEFALDVILSRTAEIDPKAAIKLIQGASLDNEQRFAAALSIASREITESNMSRILSALPQIDERRFRTEAVMRLAGSRPDQAVALVVGMHERRLRTELLHDIAMTWFARDSKAARAALATLPDEADRRAFEAGIRMRLALSDPAEVLLEAARSPSLSDGRPETALAARELAKTEPRRALELADQLVGDARETALKAVLQEWSSADPYGALGLVQKLGPGKDRDALLRTVGEQLGRQDPEGALAWFRSLETPAPGLYGAILRGLATTAPRRALELALDSADPSAEESLASLTSTALESGEVSFAHVADRMLAMSNRVGRDAGVPMLMSAWIDEKPQEAMRWIVDHSEQMGRAALGQAAVTLARRDPDAAIRYTEMLPTEYKDGWISAVALGYAQSDLAGAKRWMDQFRGEAVYDAGMTAIVRSAAMQHPADAAAMLPSFAAADARDQAATAVAQMWTMRDPDAAQDWVKTLPSGPLRDAALRGTMATSDAVPEASTLALFQSSQARQQAILDIAYRKAQVDLDDARAIVERHIADPAVRDQAEQRLERIGARPVGPFGK